MNPYKSQTYTLVRDEAEPPEVPVKHYALLDDAGRQPRKRSRAALTVTMVLIGLLAGWIGGISLTGAFQRSKSASDVPSTAPTTPVDETVVPASQQKSDARSSANAIAPGAKAARSADKQADPQSSVELKPPPATRVDEEKVQEDRPVDVPTGEQSTKQIGQNAMDKILKENDKIKRGKHLKANKNEE